MKVISKTIKIKAQNLPVCAKFIEEEILKHNIDPLRWAIVDVNKNELKLNVSGLV